MLSGGRFILGVGTGENINEGPLGFPFPGYKERIARMDEALQIIHRLFAGEKVDFAGEYYTTDKAKLYSPPLGDIPVLMAAGGPKSAAFAGANAGGLITSVKVPAETIEKVITPFRDAMAARGKQTAPILATRWVVLAEDDESAWAALDTMRGLRAPGRLEAVDPMELRIAADSMDRHEILSKYTVVSEAEQMIEAYRPLVTEIGADYVAIQVASTDPEAAIDLVGRDVLPALRELAA